MITGLFIYIWLKTIPGSDYEPGVWLVFPGLGLICFSFDLFLFMLILTSSG